MTISRTTTNQSKPILLIDCLKFLNNKKKNLQRIEFQLRCGLGEVVNINKTGKITPPHRLTSTVSKIPTCIPSKIRKVVRCAVLLTSKYNKNGSLYCIVDHWRYEEWFAMLYCWPVNITGVVHCVVFFTIKDEKSGSLCCIADH